MKRKLLGIGLGLALSLLAGCSSLGNKTEVTGQSLTPKTLHATGYSRFDDSGQVPVNQRWLSAQQAAKLDAYRGLADLLYKEALDGQKTVGSQVMSDEAYRIYVDTYLREARAVDYRTVRDTLKATLELKLSPRFYRCLSGDIGVVSQCLQEDNKLAFTRIGTKPATVASANLACGSRDCSDQFYVQGFSKERNPVDNFLLNAGMYDVEWAAHTSVNIIGRYIFMQEFLNGLY